MLKRANWNNAISLVQWCKIHATTKFKVMNKVTRGFNATQTIKVTKVKLFSFWVSSLKIQKPLLCHKDYLLPGFFQVDDYLRNVSAFCYFLHISGDGSFLINILKIHNLAWFSPMKTLGTFIILGLYRIEYRNMWCIWERS